MSGDTTGPTPFAWCRQVGDEVCVEFGDGIVAGRFDLDVASCAAYTAEALNAAVAARERKAATEATACDACDGSGNAASGIRCGCNGQGIHEMLLSVREELTGSVRRERAAAAKAYRTAAKEVRARLRFDSGQRHLFGWHEVEDLVAHLDSSADAIEGGK